MSVIMFCVIPHERTILTAHNYHLVVITNLVKITPLLRTCTVSFLFIS